MPVDSGSQAIATAAPRRRKRLANPSHGKLYRARLDAAARERDPQQAEERAACERLLDEQRAKQAPAPIARPKWGTPEAKRQRQEIEQRNRGG
jgi:hypothetical protein